MCLPMSGSWPWSLLTTGGRSASYAVAANARPELGVSCTVLASDQAISREHILAGVAAYIHRLRAAAEMLSGLGERHEGRAGFACLGQRGGECRELARERHAKIGLPRHQRWRDPIRGRIGEVDAVQLQIEM